jgi:hypothetical protein
MVTVFPSLSVVGSWDEVLLFSMDCYGTFGRQVLVNALRDFGNVYQTC